jgi:hypothetical protein
MRQLQLVSGVDDADPPSPLTGCRAEKADRAPDLIDRDHGAQRAGRTGGAFQHEQIGVRLRGDTAGHRMIR